MDNRMSARYIVIDIHEKSVKPRFTQGSYIYKVPEYLILRKENDDAYTPRLISIGPIHRKNERLKQMEEQKLVYFKYFCRRLLDVWQQDLEGYTAELEDDEQQIRSYYSEKYTDMDKKKFVGMILLDAVFIMELFLREWEEPYVIPHFDDHLFHISWIRWTIRRDLLLVENQIPFFVLERLYKLVPAGQHERRHSSFLDLACNYYKAYDPYPGIDNKDDVLMPEWDKPIHFTDLLRYFCVPKSMAYQKMDPGTYPPIRTATQLKDAGITFEPILGRCLLDIDFKEIVLSGEKRGNACLQLPILNIDDLRECILRNIMVFEQIRCPRRNFVCHYVGLLDRLIQTEQDVDVLVKSQVIAFKPGSDKDVASLINNLGKNVHVNMACYRLIARKLDRHCQDNCSRILAPSRYMNNTPSNIDFQKKQKEHPDCVEGGGQEMTNKDDIGSCHGSGMVTREEMKNMLATVKKEMMAMLSSQIDTITNPLKRLRATMKNVQDPIQIYMDYEIVGEAYYFWINQKDVMELLTNDDLCILVIQFFLIYLHRLCTLLGKSDRFGFLCPHRIQEVGNDLESRANYIQRRLNEGNKEYYLAPYHYGHHWQLVIISPKQNVKFLCPLWQEPREELKNLIDMALGKKATWDLLQCRKQPGSKECGYYVMKHMFNIISLDTSNPFEQIFNDKEPYSEEEINKIQICWANYFFEFNSLLGKLSFLT